MGAEIADLPLFVPSDDIPLAYHESDFRRVASAGYDSFIRPVSYDSVVLGNKGLRDTLEETDAVFETIALRCGATVVSHEWGVIPRDEKLVDGLEQGRKASLLNDYKDLLPVEFALAARVAVVKDTRGRRLSPLEMSAVEEAVHGHRLTAQVGSLVWSDGEAHQFRPSGASRSASRKVWLIDIEPAMKRKPEEAISFLKRTIRL